MDARTKIVIFLGVRLTSNRNGNTAESQLKGREYNPALHSPCKINTATYQLIRLEHILALHSPSDGNIVTSQPILIHTRDLHSPGNRNTIRSQHSYISTHTHTHPRSSFIIPFNSNRLISISFFYGIFL